MSEEVRLVLMYERVFEEAGRPKRAHFAILPEEDFSGPFSYSAYHTGKLILAVCGAQFPYCSWDNMTREDPVDLGHGYIWCPKCTTKW